jgi:hypothetical protein
MPETIKLDNDMILDRQHVEVGGYTVILDPATYVTRLEILLSEWGERSTALLNDARKAEESGDFDLAERKIAEEREYVAGLLEQVLGAKALPVDLAEPGRIVQALEKVYAQCVDSGGVQPLARWIEDTKERLSYSLNPGWDKATIMERIPSARRMYKLINFFVRVAGGMMTPLELERLKNPPAERPDVPLPESPSSTGAAPLPTSASATRRTPRRR